MSRFDVQSADGTPLAVWVEGGGPPLVMVHGSITEHTTFDPFVARPELGHDSCLRTAAFAPGAGVDRAAQAPQEPTSTAGRIEGDHLAARAAAAHEQEASRLVEQLELSRTALAAAQARAEAADHRAASAEEAARHAAEHAVQTEASMSRLQVEVAKAQAAVESANQRAASAERLLEQARADLQAERVRHDTSLSQLHEQLAELIARKPTRRPATKSDSSKKRTAALSVRCRRTAPADSSCAWALRTSS